MSGLSSLVGAAVVISLIRFVLPWVGRGSDVPEGVLAYSRRAWAMVIGVWLLPLFLLGTFGLFLPSVGPEFWMLTLGVFLLMSPIAAYLGIEISRIRHRFDEEGLRYRSPWTAHRALAWRDVCELRWRPLNKWLDIHVPGVRVCRISPVCGGLEDFARKALSGVPEEVLRKTPEARAALQLMADGRAGLLIYDRRSPLDILAAG